MFKYLQNFKIKDFRLDRTFKNNRRNRTFFNLENMKEVVILFTFSDLMQIILIADHLEHQGKKVHLWTEMHTDTLAENKRILIKNTRAIKPSEISRFFIVKSEVKNEFDKLKYDTLIDLTTQYSVVTEYLLALNKASFCIGNREHKYKAFDFVILNDNSKDIVDTYNQVLFYLKKITS